MGNKDIAKKVRDFALPLLAEEAYQRIMQIYKPGIVDPQDTVSAGITMSKKKPIRIVRNLYGTLEFYAIYKLMMPLLITIKEFTTKDLLQENIDFKIHAGNITDRKEQADGTLLLYAIDFWITKDGEIWQEESHNLWRRINLRISPNPLVNGNFTFSYKRV